MQYEAVIGLEIHAQLLTNSKIFCSCSTKFGALPNNHTCPVCLGLPGSLPVLNKKVVEFAIKAGLAMNCTINSRSVFARKNYFYPDLPKGYQISQFELPIAEQGFVEIVQKKERRKIRITRIHLEEDAGKNKHAEGSSYSLVDFNRCGVPLIEIVTEPDIKSPKEAALFIKTVRSILRYLEICDGNMEEGSLRCDANISIRQKGATELGVKAELKNMNSFRFVTQALDYEIERQIDRVDDGKPIIQESRLWDINSQTTKSMRSKEEAHDYRYFPDPDLVPVDLDMGMINKVREEIPELPSVRLNRFIKDYNLPYYDAEVLISEKEIADYFETAAENAKNKKKVANWILTELLGELKKNNLSILECLITPEKLSVLIEYIEDNTISGKIAKTVFKEMYNTGKSAGKIIEEQGLKQITDEKVVKEIVHKLLDSNKSKVQEYKNGKTKLLGFFVGQIMKQTTGKANPDLVNKLLNQELNKT